MQKLIFVIVLALIATSSSFAQEYERYKKLLDTTITSVHLGFDKSITVTVPFEWQEDVERDFPLIILFDKQNPRSHNYILNTIDYLTSNEQMPSAVIISVESEQEHRYHETLHRASSEKGLALENERFLFEELIPLAEGRYKASSFRLLVGHSRYGYFTTALFCSRTSDLSAVISLSPFFTQNQVNLTDSISKLEKEGFTATKYYRYGIGNDYPDDFHQMDSTLFLLSNPEIDAKGSLFPEADHNVTPGLTIGPALYEVFEEWSRLQAKYISNDQKDLSIIQSIKREIAKTYGSQLSFSLGILNGKGWYFYNENQFDKAIEAWEIMMETYPNFSEGYLYMLDAQKEGAGMESETIEKFSQSLSRSNIYSEEEKKELLQELENMMQ